MLVLDRRKVESGLLVALTTRELQLIHRAVREDWPSDPAELKENFELFAQLDEMMAQRKLPDLEGTTREDVLSDEPFITPEDREPDEL